MSPERSSKPWSPEDGVFDDRSAELRLTPVALVTGASSGLGVEFTRQLAAKGHRLVLAARRKDRLDSLVAELGNARAVSIDLSEAGAVGRLMADVAAAGETVSLLVNNAGFGLVGRFADLDPARQRSMIDLNCGALVELAHAVLPEMRSRKAGTIINVASTGAFQPGPGIAVYFATKSFVLSFTEALHEELRDSGIGVTALCPGPTATEFGEVAGLKGMAVLDRFTGAAGDVVNAGLDAAAKNKAICIPGIPNKIGAQGSRLLPRALVRRLAGLVKM